MKRITALIIAAIMLFSMVPVSATFDFTVPETGAYDIFFKYAKAASGGIGYAYIDGKYVGEADFYNSSAVSTNYVEFRSVSLEAGKTHTLRKDICMI